MIKQGGSNLRKSLHFGLIFQFFLIELKNNVIVNSLSPLISFQTPLLPVPHRSNESRNNTLPSLPPQPHSTFISFSLRLCPGWIDFTLFGFDNHVYCAMKCGVAEGWQYPSTRGNLLTAGARWRYSLAQERSAHSDTTASVCATGSLAVIYDASRAITLSLTLIQQFIYCHACIRAEVSFLQRGGGRRQVPAIS